MKEEIFKDGLKSDVKAKVIVLWLNSTDGRVTLERVTTFEDVTYYTVSDGLITLYSGSKVCGIVPVSYTLRFIWNNENQV